MKHRIIQAVGLRASLFPDFVLHHFAIPIWLCWVAGNARAGKSGVRFLLHGRVTTLKFERGAREATSNKRRQPIPPGDKLIVAAQPELE